MPPDPSFWDYLTQFGLAGAAIAANMFIVLKFMNFLGNHMSKVAKSLDDLNRTTERMAQEVEHCHQYRPPYRGGDKETRDGE